MRIVNQEQDYLKLYAAFRSGCLGDNVLDVYFSFFANILLEEGVTVVYANDLCAKFEQRYQFPVPITFVRQVLSVGMNNGTIVRVKERYEVVQEKLNKYKVDLSSFESSWNSLLEGFKSFCVSNDFSINDEKLERDVLEFINSQDVDLVLNRDVYSDENTAPFDFSWNKYLQHIAKENTSLFDFMSAICFSNILKQAIFYVNDSRDDGFNGLCVYLDSPLVFSVLGMDDKERVDSVRFLIKEMKAAGCYVQVLDHNLAEVKGIITTAGNWAISTNYDIAKANNATRFFHDAQFDQQGITEFYGNIEDKLAEHGIAIRETSFDVLEHQFNEDEALLYQMVEDKYKESGYNVPPEKEYSIKVDVRSIIMLYRIRQGVVSQTIQESKHIMITQNGAIANVCKKYESNRSINSGHIPVCISADLFGTVLWFYAPDKMLEYHRKQLLADCYSILKPSKKMLDQFIQSLNAAKTAGEINEKKYLFMRSHPVVVDALMNVTKGDYARFNDRTYLEVYDDIVASSDKKYTDEVSAHSATKKQLDEQVAATAEANGILNILKEKEQAQFNKMCKIKSIRWTVVVFGAPYIVILALAEMVIGLFQGFSLWTLAGVSAVLIALALIERVRSKVYLWVYKKVRVRELKKDGKPYDNMQP
jgi:hypothetical protein